MLTNIMRNTYGDELEFLAEKLKGKIIPIRPFLRVRAGKVGVTSLQPGLEAMDKNLVPNTQAWCDHFGVAGPVLLDADEAVDGVRLALEPEADEGPDVA